MSASSLGTRVRRCATSQRNLTIWTAIVVGVPTAYAFHVLVSGGDGAGDFLLLMALAVGVPTAYDDYWPAYDRTWQAIRWVVAACVVATAVFTGLYLVGTAVVGLGPLPAAVAAFLVTDLGGLAALARRERN